MVRFFFAIWLPPEILQAYPLPSPVHHCNLLGRERTMREKKSIAEDYCRHLVQAGRIAPREFQVFSEHLARQSIEKDLLGQSPFDQRLNQLGSMKRVTKFSESFSSVGVKLRLCKTFTIRGSTTMTRRLQLKPKRKPS
jgi:hypothetical protein